MAKKTKEYTVNEIRKYYGFSQEQLATYLGVSRSTLNMTERGERGMKISAEVKLLKLVRVMMSARIASRENKNIIMSDGKLKKPLISQSLSDISFRLKYLNKKFGAIKTKNHQQRELLNALSDLKEGAEKRELIVLNLIEAKIKRKSRKSNEEEAMKMELQIHLAEAEKAFWEKKKKESK